MSTPLTPPDAAGPVPDPGWLRAKRAGIYTDAGLRDFREELDAVVDDLVTRPGSSVSVAIGWTVVAIVVALVITFVGIIVLDLGEAMWRSLREQ